MVVDVNKLRELLNKGRKEDNAVLSIANLLYEFKKLPSDLTGKVGTITGTIGNMPVNLKIQFEPETINAIVELLNYLQKRYEEEKKAFKRR